MTRKELEAQQALHGGESRHELGAFKILPGMLERYVKAGGKKARKETEKAVETVKAKTPTAEEAIQFARKLPGLFQPVFKAATLPFRVAADVVQAGGRAAAATARAAAYPVVAPVRAAYHYASPEAKARFAARQAQRARQAKSPLFSRSAKGVKEFADWVEDVARREASLHRQAPTTRQEPAVPPETRQRSSNIPEAPTGLL